MGKILKSFAALLLICALMTGILGAFAEADDGYTLEQVVILSRHNLRAPLSSNGSVPEELTPHQWIQWTSNSSELTMKGGMLETGFGEYFRKWLDSEGLIPENAVPEDGEVRFYARDKQRCRATARYFAAGLLPMADVQVEYPGNPDPEDFMKPALHFYSDEYAADATAQVAAMGGEAGFEGINAQLRDTIALIMDTVDMQDSEIYQSGKYGDLMTDPTGYEMEADKEPAVTGAIKTADQVVDALLLQYYEEPDLTKAAFGHELTEAQWQAIADFNTTYVVMRHGAPLVAINVAHPLLEVLESELKNDGRKLSFFCAHDVTVMGVLSALGVVDYELPGTIEKKTPIGVKVVFERWRDAEGQAWYKVDMVYQSSQQIRENQVLTPDNPPMTYALSFDGVEVNADGMMSEADLFGLFDGALAEYDALEAQYTELQAAA